MKLHGGEVWATGTVQDGRLGIAPVAETKVAKNDRGNKPICIIQ